MIMITEVPFYGMRPFVHMLLSGVFERFPQLKFVITEGSAAGVAADAQAARPGHRRTCARVRSASSSTPPRTRCRVGDRVLPAERLGRRELPGLADVEVRKSMGPDRFMWGSDYPHDEGTGPYSREALRQVFHRRSAKTSCARSSPATRRSSTTSTSTRSRRWPSSTGRPSRSSRSRSTELPADANEALLRVKRQQDEMAAA